MHRITKLIVVIGLLGPLAETVHAQTADEIVEKSLAAAGGRAALGKLKSRHVTGTVAFTTPLGDLPGTVETFNQAPNKSRTLMKLDLSAAGVGLVSLDQRFNGETGYVLDSVQGNRDITGPALDALKTGSFPTPFLDYKERGGTVELRGKEKVNEHDAYVLTYTPKGGISVRWSIDVESYLPIRSIMKVNVPQLGSDVEQITAFSDYRDVDGIKMPFLITNVSVQSFSITVTKVEHNVPIDETLFSKPADGK
jgi:hypothetical protein